MAATTTFFAFTPNGYLYNCPAKRSHSTLPDAVSQRLENSQPKIAEVYHACFADNGAYLVTYRAAEEGKYNFVGVEHRGLSQSLIQWLGQYPNYRCDIPSVRVVFGPHGQYFAWDKNGHHPGAVLPAVANSLQQDGGPLANPPRIFALGPGGSYLLVKQGGQYYYDLNACSAETDQYFDRLCELHIYPNGRPGAFDELLNFSLSTTKPGHWFSIWKNGTVVSAVSHEWHNMLAPTTAVIKEYLQTVFPAPGCVSPTPSKPSAQVNVAEIRPSPVSAGSINSLHSASPSLHAPQPMALSQAPAQHQGQYAAAPQVFHTPSPHDVGVAEMQAGSPVAQQPGSPTSPSHPTAIQQPQVQHSQQQQHQIPQLQTHQMQPQRPQSVQVQRPPLQHQQSQPVAPSPAGQTQTWTPTPPPQFPSSGQHAQTPSISGASMASQPQPQLQHQQIQQNGQQVQQQLQAQAQQQAAQRPPVQHHQPAPSIAPSTQSVDTTTTATSTGSAGKTGAKLKKMFKGVTKAGKDLYNAQMHQPHQQGHAQNHQQHHSHHHHHLPHHGHHGQHNQQPQGQANSTQQNVQVTQQVTQQLNQTNMIQQNSQIVQQAPQQPHTPQPVAGQPQRIQYVQRIVQTPQGPQMQVFQIQQQPGRPSVSSVSSQPTPMTPQSAGGQSSMQQMGQTTQQVGSAVQVIQQANQIVQSPQPQSVQTMQQRPPIQTQASSPGVQQVQGKPPQQQQPQQVIQLQQQIVQNTSTTPQPQGQIRPQAASPQPQMQPGGRASKLGIEPNINFNPTFNFGGSKEERGGGGGGGHHSQQQQRPQQQPYYQEQPYYAQQPVIYQPQPIIYEQQPIIYEQQPIIYEQAPGQTVIVENSAQPGEVVVMESGTGPGYFGETVVVDQGTVGNVGTTGYSETVFTDQGVGASYITTNDAVMPMDATGQADMTGLTGGVQAMSMSDTTQPTYAYAEPSMALSPGTDQATFQDGTAAWGMSGNTAMASTDSSGVVYVTATEQVSTDQYGTTEVQYQQTEIAADANGNVFAEQQTIDVQTDAYGDVSYEETDVAVEFDDDGGGDMGDFGDDW